MGIFITFFRDILDGPLYFITSFICGILFCSCIGYLAETHFNKKKQAENYQNTHANVSYDYSSNIDSNPANQNVNMPSNVQQMNPSINQQQIDGK